MTKMFNQILLETLFILILKIIFILQTVLIIKVIYFDDKKKNEKYELHKINVDGDIDSLIQVGENQILELLTRKSKFVLIDLTSLEKTSLDISYNLKNINKR